MIGYSYSPLSLHVCKTENTQTLLNKQAGRLFTPPFSEEQYLTTGGIQYQSTFECKRVFQDPSEVSSFVFLLDEFIWLFSLSIVTGGNLSLTNR